MLACQAGVANAAQVAGQTDEAREIAANILSEMLSVPSDRAAAALLDSQGNTDMAVAMLLSEINASVPESDDQSGQLRVQI